MITENVGVDPKAALARVGLMGLRLASGGHHNRTQGVCLMEAVAWWAEEPHSDAPACVCRQLRGMGIELNDQLPEEKRQRLVPLVPLLVGTRDDGMLERRGLMAADWLIRTYTPAWLRLAKLDVEAEALERLPEITDFNFQESLVALKAAQKSASAAGSAAGSAARSAAESAAWSAAESAAWSAAESAAWSAAESAAGQALAPVVDRLQDSAIDLYVKMVQLRPETAA